MTFLEEIRFALECIGAGTVFYGFHYLWRQGRRAGTSAKQSRRAYEAQTTVKAVEDRDDIGVEVPWNPGANRPQK